MDFIWINFEPRQQLRKKSVSLEQEKLHLEKNTLATDETC